jgi:hypothetical protein
MGGVCLIEEVDPTVENLIRRAAILLGYGLSELEVRDLLMEDTVTTEQEVYFAIKAAVVLNR